MPERIPLYYTFGNHQHWVDLQWLWGYHVMPGAIGDSLHFSRETGAKGCVNFDGIGYEKLAAEDPKALADLKEAIEKGTFEIVGGSYGQPYGLFHGGESNIRQRIFGARASRRLFGVPVKTFWEEEFDFFPQLPQILRGVGIEYASLFFQWTWHTPEVPKEDVPVIWWEGQDGSRLLCATRNKLNLHQWPEDMALTFAELAESYENEPAKLEGPIPLILQWLELMPSPDWMCRSEVVMPKLKELLADPRFEIRPVTLGEYLRIAEADATVDATFPVRRYTMDQVWHGMTLGKNGDEMRRRSREGEAALLSAETLAAVAGLFGRPYAQWDVYPTWELEEAWRELLSAQHHDNDECEGLCGHVGKFIYDKSKKMGRHISSSNLRELARRVAGGNVKMVAPQTRSLDGDEHEGQPRMRKAFVFNPLGWEVRAEIRPDGALKESSVVTIPPFGYATYDSDPLKLDLDLKLKRAEVSEIEFEGITAIADLSSGILTQIASPQFPDGVFASSGAFGCMMQRDGATASLVHGAATRNPGEPFTVGPNRSDASRDHVRLSAQMDRAHRGIRVHAYSHIKRPDGGLNAALQTSFHLSFRPKLIADQPLGVSEIEPTPKGLKKYPTGDWMTSPQWFEEVHDAFTALTFVDLVDADDPDRGLLIVHDGAQQWFLDEESRTVRCILNAYDPWDEDYFRAASDTNFLLVPHGPMTNSQRWKLAQEWLRPPFRAYFEGDPVGPAAFSAASCDAENVALTAFYRETRDSAKGQVAHASDVLGVDYPYVIRLLELDGIETDAILTFGATVAKAIRTNLLGEPEEELQVEQRSKVRVHMKPYQVATVYLDLVEGRKQVRDLDAKREIWATVHRVE